MKRPMKKGRQQMSSMFCKLNEQTREARKSSMRKQTNETRIYFALVCEILLVYLSKEIQCLMISIN